MERFTVLVYQTVFCYQGVRYRGPLCVLLFFCYQGVRYREKKSSVEKPVSMTLEELQKNVAK